jgi:hypothetical protein
MRFSIQPEQRPEARMRTVSIDEVLLACENTLGARPPLEHYFSPTKKDSFVKKYLHYLNTGLLEAKHGNLDTELYLAFVLSFQFTAPLLDIPAEKELGLFYRILQKTYGVEELDLNLHFSTEAYEGNMVGEKEALKAFRQELEGHMEGLREVKESVQLRLKKDATKSILDWQREHTIPLLAEAFGRSIVIPSFFTFKDKKLIQFYRANTQGIIYRVAVPENLT